MWTSRPTVVLAAALCAFGASAAPAQQSRDDYPRNVLYLEVTPLLFIGNVSVNYERRLNPWLSARAGVGAGYVWVVFTGLGAAGATTMLLYSSPHTNSKFEAGLGASFVTAFAGNPDAHLLPAASLGYRHEPISGGFVFRTGLTWVYSYGLPLQVSFGVNF